MKDHAKGIADSLASGAVWHQTYQLQRLCLHAETFSKYFLVTNNMNAKYSVP